MATKRDENWDRMLEREENINQKCLEQESFEIKLTDETAKRCNSINEYFSFF